MGHWVLGATCLQASGGIGQVSMGMSASFDGETGTCEGVWACCGVVVHVSALLAQARPLGVLGRALATGGECSHRSSLSTWCSQWALRERDSQAKAWWVWKAPTLHSFESASFPFGGPVLGSLPSPRCVGEEARVPSNLLSMEAWGLMRPACTPMPLGTHSASQDWPKQEFLVAPAGGGLSPLLPVPWVLPCLGASLLPCLPQTLLASTMLAQGPWCGGPCTGPEALSWGGRSKTLGLPAHKNWPWFWALLSHCPSPALSGVPRALLTLRGHLEAPFWEPSPLRWVLSLWPLSGIYG